MPSAIVIGYRVTQVRAVALRLYGPVIRDGGGGSPGPGGVAGEEADEAVRGVVAEAQLMDP